MTFKTYEPSLASFREVVGASGLRNVKNNSIDTEFNEPYNEPYNSIYFLNC